MKSQLRACAAVILLAIAAQAQTVSIQGTVLSVSGQPVVGATCQFRKAGNKAVTDAQGHYSFSGNVAVRPSEGYSIAVSAQGGELSLRLDRAAKAAVDLYGVDGRHVRTLVDAALPSGVSRFGLGEAARGHQLYLVRVRLGAETAWHKLTLQGEFSAVSAEGSATGLAKAEAGIDSLFCTSDVYDGGLAKINGRAVNAYTGTQNFRMFSTDAAWKVCSPPVTFNFDGSAGVDRYKQLIADPVSTEQHVLMEVCQSTYKLASQAKKYTTYVANIKSGAGGQVAATGGNTLGFSTEYIAGQPNTYAGWWELVGVQTHEAVHSYQPYYSTSGADGFGEAMPDAVRALNGFFRWPTGTKCNGSYTDVYQTGGKYWYFIEMKHPGFLTAVWQDKVGTIADRVQKITGESLTAMASECQTKGMP